jgi:hypothetical protein
VTKRLGQLVGLEACSGPDTLNHFAMSVTYRKLINDLCGRGRNLPYAKPRTNPMIAVQLGDSRCAIATYSANREERNHRR